MTVSPELLALLGIDTSSGRDDILHGDDFLLGTLSGGAGNDYVEGKGGLDLLTGGTGSDTVGYSESDVGVHINLGNLLLGLLGAWGGDADGDVLVNGFENVVGSAHADVITGDGGANILVGLEDADRLDGSGGDDTLIGGIGADVLIGDRGSDTASYALAAAGVTVSLSTGTGTQGEAAGDTLTGIENLTGSAFADVLEGSALANRIQAGAGDDTIIGTDGLDVIDGGAGDDTLDFSANTTGVTIDFGTGRYTSIEGILGGNGSDTIYLAAANPAGLMTLAAAAEDTAGAGADGGDGDDTIDGDDTANTLNGGAGNDTLNGNAGDDTIIYSEGADTVTGGDGDDVYVFTASGVAATPSASDAVAASQVIDGGTFNAGSGHDAIRFNEGPDWAAGKGYTITWEPTTGSGHQISLRTWDHPELTTVTKIESEAFGEAASSSQVHGAVASTSSVTIEGSNMDDTISDDSGTTFDWSSDGRDGNDIIAGGNGQNVINGGSGDDSLNGGNGDDALVGGAGADALDGGDGVDTADYSQSSTGVTVNLWNGTGQFGDAAGDTLVNVENLVGSANVDVLIGDDIDNVLIGGGGEDTLDGANGSDMLDGGAGKDRITTGNGSDLIRYTSIDDSTSSAPDTILDFFHSLSGGDHIDLSAIDADPSTPEDDAFRITDIDGQHVPGDLTLEFIPATGAGGGGLARINAYVDGDQTADFTIEVRVDAPLSETDIIP